MEVRAPPHYYYFYVILLFILLLNTTTTNNNNDNKNINNNNKIIRNLILTKSFVNILITTGFLDFVHRPEFYKQENTTFRKLDLFPSSGEGGGHLL
jgi:hypothetical protein